MSIRKRRSINTPKEVVDAFTELLDQHQDIVTHHKKGSTAKLQQLFKDATGYDMNPTWIRSHLFNYRLAHNIKVEYRYDKYYTSERKQAVQSPVAAS